MSTDGMMFEKYYRPPEGRLDVRLRHKKHARISFTSGLLQLNVWKNINP